MPENHEMPGIILYKEDLNLLSMLPDGEFVTIMRAIVDYALDGEKPEWINERNAETKRRRRAFMTIVGKLDRDAEKYARKLEQTKEAGKKSARKRKMNFSIPEQGKMNENSTLVQRPFNERSTNVQQTETQTVTQTVTQTSVTQTISAANKGECEAKIHEALMRKWNDEELVNQTPIKKLIDDGYLLEDIEEAAKKAKENHAGNPVGYLLTILENWQRNGKPKKTVDYLQHPPERRLAAYEVNLDDLEAEDEQEQSAVNQREELTVEDNRADRG